MGLWNARERSKRPSRQSISTAGSAGSANTAGGVYTRPAKQPRTECPTCGFLLAGNRFNGFTCGRCKAHYSGKFIAHVQRQHLKHLIRANFDGTFDGTQSVVTSMQPRTTHETEQSSTKINLTLQERATKDRIIERALSEAHSAARTATAHLEEMLKGAEEAEEATAHVKKVAISISEPVSDPDPAITLETVTAPVLSSVEKFVGRSLPSSTIIRSRIIAKKRKTNDEKKIRTTKKPNKKIVPLKVVQSKAAPSNVARPKVVPLSTKKFILKKRLLKKLPLKNSSKSSTRLTNRRAKKSLLRAKPVKRRR